MWLCNIVLFAVWYWRLDAGGPYARHARGRHTEGAFLFPPMTQDGRPVAQEPLDVYSANFPVGGVYTVADARGIAAAARQFVADFPVGGVCTVADWGLIGDGGRTFRSSDM